VSISPKQWRSIAENFGVEESEVRRLARVHRVSDSARAVRRLLTELGVGKGSEGGVTVVGSGGGGGAVAKRGRGRPAVHPAPAWFLEMGYKQAEWRGWHRFFTGSGPNDLSVLVPGCSLEPRAVVDLWRGLGQRKSLAKLVAAIRSLQV